MNGRAGTRPLDVGLTIWLARPLDDSVALAEAAEDSGFSAVWLPDHYFLRDAFVAQALIARATERVAIGTAVASPLLRHPTLLASAAASIDEVSGGRVVLGVGAGGFEFPTQLKMDMRGPLGMVRETVEIARALFAGRAEVEGEAFSAVGAELSWRPGRVPPIYMAARGPRMLELAGEIADGVIVHGLAESHLDFVAERLGVGAARAGRDPGDCDPVVMMDVELDDDPDRAVERLRPRCTVMVGGSYSEKMIPVFGLDPDEVLPIRRRVSAGDLDGATGLLTDEMVRAFGVAGPDEALAQELDRLRRRGITRTILNVGGGSREDAVARVRRAGKVIREVSV